MQLIFSHDSKDVMAESGNIAIDLGYDYISTIHIFLGDQNPSFSPCAQTLLGEVV